MNNTFRMFIHTFLFMAAMNGLNLFIADSNVYFIILLFRLLSHMQFFTFSVVAACVTNNQRIGLVVALLFITLASMSQPVENVMVVIFPVAFGYLVGTGLQRMSLENGGKIHPPTL